MYTWLFGKDKRKRGQLSRSQNNNIFTEHKRVISHSQNNIKSHHNSKQYLPRADARHISQLYPDFSVIMAKTQNHTLPPCMF